MNIKLPSITNKKHHLIIFASVVFLIFAYYYYKYLLFLDTWKVVSLKNDTVCQRAELWAAPQDFAYLQDNILIAGVDDKLSIHQLHQLQITASGGLIAFDPNLFPSYQNVTMNGFPFEKGIRFYPHGIYLNRENKLLYAINHAYKYGGERVEIFQMGFEKSSEGVFDGRQVTANYVGFIKFDDIHMGILNDLVVIGDHVFISQFQPFPDSQNGREHGKLKSYERLAKFVIGGYTNIYRCPVVINKPGSKKVEITQCNVFLNDGTEYNGVQWDGGKYLYVSDVMKWKVRRVELNQDRNKFLSIVDIDVVHGPDNVLLSPDKKKLWVGVLASRKEFLEFTKMARLGRKDEAKVSGGMVEIDLQTLKAEDVVIQRNLNCASVAIRDDDWVYIGSWQDWGIGRCRVSDKAK